ncbi:MAG: DtxR family Mn-dependent transcriptional regulator [Saprospiraceae bacterium]|jgi:DtxR family Mn-dependent transcriptional regulator
MTNLFILNHFNSLCYVCNILRPEVINMKISQTEENYLKAIYKLMKIQPKGVLTKSIGELLAIKSPTVSDMLKKLSDKKLIKYTKYKGVTLTKSGEKIALKVIRKHRLWETFLVERFEFKWDEVHDIAEQLEHVESPELVRRLDKYLDFPKFDPHGDPIPNEEGVFLQKHDLTLNQVNEKEEVIMVGVKDHSSQFLQYLDASNLRLGTKITVVEIIEYDNSYVVELESGGRLSLSDQVAKNLIVK